MKQRLIPMLVALAATSLMISCGEDDPEPEASLTVSSSTIALGEVTAGTSATSEFTISAENVTGSLTLSVTGDGFSLNETTFPVATATNKVTLTFAPDASFTLGAASGTINVTAGELSETISVSATVLEAPPSFLTAGSVIYSSGFEMGKSSDSGDANGHGSALVASDLDGVATIFTDLTAVHTVTNYDDGDETTEDKGVRVQSQRGMCNDTASGGLADADDNDDENGNCGNAFSIQGAGTSVKIAISGLTAGQPATVTYWLRLHGSSERGLDASFTGGTTLDHAFTDGTGDSKIYTEYSITGAADANGDLVFMVEADLPTTTNSRGISVDNVTIEAN